MMAARIFRGLESKQTRACAAHDSAPLTCISLSRIFRQSLAIYACLANQLDIFFIELKRAPYA